MNFAQLKSIAEISECIIRDNAKTKTKITMFFFKLTIIGDVLLFSL